MNQGESIIISAEALKTLRETRYNPGRNITASKLASILEAFEYGDIRESAMLWEQIAERDDTVKCVKPKREKSVSALIPVYEATEDSGEAGEAQREVLKKFWSNVRATNAYDRNVSGGLRLLIQQWMTAVSFRYAVHHIVWSPRRDGLTATFEYVPLWLFENKTGKLRFLRNPFNVNGEDMEPGEWLVTAGEGLMIAVSIGWLAKRDTYNDWLIFSSRFSTPGILGRTRAAQDSPEGRAMKQAVMAFGRELKAVCYGDDGSIKDPIQIIQADGTPTGQPMPSLIERIDRKFSALYRGNDLGTMSAGNGEGTGASLQGEETDILLDDDIAMCEEKLAEVSRMVLEWHFGEGTEVLASVKLKSKKEVAEAKAQVSGVRSQESAPKKEELENAEKVPSDQSAVISGSEELVALLQDGYADVAALIEKALKATGTERDDLLQEAMALLPDMIGNDEMDDAVTKLLTRAFLGEGEEVENAARKNPQPKGAKGRFVIGKVGDFREGETQPFSSDVFGRVPSPGNSLTEKDNLERAKRAIDWAFRNKQRVNGVVYREGLGRVDLWVGRTGIIKQDYNHGEGINHISAKHPEEVNHIALTLAKGEIHPAKENGQNKIILTHKGYIAVLGENKNQKNSWIVTHYYDSEK